ncbi:AT-hook motif nuclear-localized protein 17 [Raphanus sativus]|nr:AT-hook motif nuclear-localized protein 17 [Raphanus sativus]KAJ4915775.1 AT-hook motif nuclear-localized protein 17 [Raphanus sativus]
MEAVPRQRPRGRPQGSKNKPKPPVYLTLEPPMSPYILQVPSGNDVVASIDRFCRERGGQIVGGFVSGPLISAGPVYVVAASLNNPSYHRLPVAEEKGENSSGEAEAKEGKGRSPPVSGGGGGESCRIDDGSDVVWAPAAILHNPSL